MSMFFKRSRPNGHVIYRNDEPQFVAERGGQDHSNCVALIPMSTFTTLLDQEQNNESV